MKVLVTGANGQLGTDVCKDLQGFEIISLTHGDYEFTKEILKLVGLKTPVIPVTSDQYPQKARRPRFSVLDNYHLRLLGMDDMRQWQNALADYMREKGHINKIND